MSTPAPAGSPPLLYQLSPRTVLRLSGPDRHRYLNGQVTQDVRLATGDAAIYACVLNAKGQLEAVCHIREHDGSFLLDAPRALREDLMARLDRYIIADDVELTDESDHWQVAHLPEGPPPAGIPHWHCTRLDRPGWDLFSPDPIPDTGFEPATEELFLETCTARGIPSWGTELTPGLLPPEAGLDRSAISYDKGCYLGQEVISRIKRAGKTNQHLVALAVPSGTKAPAILIHDDHEAGRLTSVANASPDHPHDASSTRALGFRKRKFADITDFSLRDETGTPLDGVATVIRFAGPA